VSNAIKLKITLFACLLLLAVGGGILGQTGVEKTSPSSEKNSPASGNEATSNSDPAEVVRKAYKNLEAARSYRAHIRLNNLGINGWSEFKFEFVAPERRRTIPANPELGLKSSTIEFIEIEGTIYTRRKGSPTKWEKPTKWESADFDDRSINNIFFVTMLENSSSIKVVGPETLDGVPTMVYQFLKSETEKDGIKTSLTLKIWVGVRDNLPYKVEMESSFSGREIQMWNSGTTVNFYDYGVDIKIEPPI
jgi:hypothetical protein